MPDDKEVPLCADLIVRSLFHCLGGLARSFAGKEQLSIFTTSGTQRSYINVNGGWVGDGYLRGALKRMSIK